MKIDYIRTDTAPFYEKAADTRSTRELLWGDRVELAEEPAPGATRVSAKARGSTGYVRVEDLGGQPLLEVYFIDVGQGDGVLVATPDGRHILIDGGYKRSAQPTGKNAADFVDWKFVRDLGRPGIELDAMIASHNDADHYGGLWDLLNPAARGELDATGVTVKRFYTAGVGWFRSSSKARYLGPTVTRNSETFLTGLLSSRADAQKWLKTSASPRLQGEWADFIRTVVDHGCPIDRLSHRTGWLPEFGPNDTGRVQVRVLGPVESTVSGKPALRSLGSDSQNTNGNSVVLRLDYDRVRILLTGDLNGASQAALMRDHPGGPGEFAADVVKACHHGSDDCSIAFLRAIGAAATVISSGDAEGHCHPRPGIVAASGATGHLQVLKDRMVTPLVYCTETARSYRLGKITEILDGQRQAVPNSGAFRARYQETDPGSLTPRTRDRRLAGSYLVSGLVYGLVNVRTDGRRILCATLNESSRAWDLETFDSRF